MAPAVVAVRGAAKRWLGSGTRLFLPGDVFGDAGRFSFLCTAWTLAADHCLTRQQIAPALLDTDLLRSPPPQSYSIAVKLHPSLLRSLITSTRPVGNYHAIEPRYGFTPQLVKLSLGRCLYRSTLSYCREGGRNSKILAANRASMSIRRTQRGKQTLCSFSADLELVSAIPATRKPALASQANRL
jgi:hypothetical protein